MESWTLENGEPSGEIGILPTYYASLVWAQQFLSFPYFSIKTLFLVISKDAEQEWSILFTSQSMTSKQRCTYGHTLIFVVLASRMRYPYTRFFYLCPLNANVARWWNGHSSSNLPVLEYTVVDHGRLMCYDLYQRPKVFLNVENHSSQNDPP